MLARIREFLASRTGEAHPLSGFLATPVAGGPRFAHSPGAILLAVVALQGLTGFVLAMHYAPSVTTAWASVAFFEDRIRGGAFVRALHSWGASAVVVACALHFVQCAVRRSYRAPREVTWALGLVLALVVLAFTHTGYVLPWDQKGYWATRVATNIAAATPVVGTQLQRLAVGGEEPGNLTLTRFYAVHVILLPLVLVTLLGAHLRLVKRHGLTPAEGGSVETTPWFPQQAFRDLLAALAALSVLAFLAFHHGAPLEAPADPSSDFQPRPEWYFLPLYELLKFFPSRLEFVGSEVIPGLVFAALVALPWLDRRSPRLALGVAFGPLAVAIAFGALAVANDLSNQELAAHRREEAKDALLARKLFRDAKGVPASGALALLDAFPPRQGARLYKEKCASCHQGRSLKGPDLRGYLSPRWLEEAIRDPAALYGAQDAMGKTDAKADGIAALAAFVGSLESDEHARALNGSMVAKGKALYEDQNCDSCHESKPGKPSDEAPNLAGYGSEEWLVRFMKQPKTFFGDKNKMPAFGDKLTEAELHALAVHLRGLRNPETDE